MTTKDLSFAVGARDIMNSRVKRKEIEEPKHYGHVVCGCGEEGCIWISIQGKLE
jgi:hypothetical protein